LKNGVSNKKVTESNKKVINKRATGAKEKKLCAPFPFPDALIFLFILTPERTPQPTNYLPPAPHGIHPQPPAVRKESPPTDQPPARKDSPQKNPQK